LKISSPSPGVDTTSARTSFSDERLIRVAHLYYFSNNTQQQIAEKLNTSRPTVVRMLQDARRRGLVRIEIAEPRTSVALGQSVVDRFSSVGLRAVYLAPSAQDPEAQASLIARRAAEVFRPVAGQTIAVTWGTTLSKVCELIAPVPSLSGISVVSVFGGIRGQISAIDPYEVANLLGRKLRASVYSLTAPPYVRSIELWRALLDEPMVRETLARAEGADLLLFGAGGLDPHGTMSQYQVLAEDELAWLKAKGCVGDFVGRFVDMQGRELDITERLFAIGLEWHKLLAIPNRMCIAGGLGKRDVIRSLLQAGAVTELVTDTDTAQALLDRT
jgi:DNA-binding transcriptional regulator LsrR (DeoR family)